MIPVALSLRNFMSYGEEVPPLEFGNLHLACLSGPNGAGKSALLDAITWALWGEARKPRGTGTARPETYLLRLGAAEMQVQFVFDLEGDRYCVRRTYLRQRDGGRVGLELQVYDPHQETYHPLTEPNLRATQQKITQLLRMDYQTFVNSAFLMQGRADEFSRRTPRERKQVLADILGLSYYDQLTERARERARSYRQRVMVCESTLETLGEQLRQRETLQQELSAAEADLQGVEVDLAEREAALQRLDETYRHLQGLQQRLDSLRSAERRLHQMVETLRPQAEAVEQQWGEASRWLEREAEIKGRLLEYEELRRQLQEFDEKAERRRKWEEEAHSLREVIAQEHQRLQSALEARRDRLLQIEADLRQYEALLRQADTVRAGAARLEEVRRALLEEEERRRQRDELEQMAQELERSLSRRRAEWEGRRQALQQELEKLRADANAEAALRARLQDLQRQIQRLQQLARQREEVAQEREHLRARLAGLREEHQRLEKEAASTSERLRMLETAAGAICPLCRTELGADGLGHVRREYEGWFAQFESRQAALAQEARDLQRRLKTGEEQIKEWELSLQALSPLQNQWATLQQQWSQACQAREAIIERERQMARLESELEQEAYAPEIARRLAEIRQRQQAIGYQADRHRRLQQEQRQLEPFAARLAQLQMMEAETEQRKTQRPVLEREVAELERRLGSHDYAPVEQARFQELRFLAEALGYDREQHRRVQQQVAERLPVLAEGERLAEMQQRYPLLSQQRDTLRAQLEAHAAEHREVKREIDRLTEELHLLPGVRSEWENTQRDRDRLRARRADLQTQAARVRGQLQHLGQLDEQRRALERERESARRQQELHERLTVAFGKDGIQAWLIERAIPEIEQSANQLLQRLTQGQAQIAIEPLKDLRTGGVRESLDIYISDGAGTRPYEMFSGGEAFRIDFALRIALSQLLVGRAGARLRTLVIDEGFGTQDQEGIGLLVEAIQQIADDFDRILVVTHLEELKDAFPVRIEIHKSPQRGSWFEMVA